MAPRPPAKRADSETFASSFKKMRFLDPNEDFANFYEQVKPNLEPPHTRTEGCECDSSDDSGGVANSRKPANDTEGGGDNMFGSAAAKQKKPVENAKGQESSGSGLGDGPDPQNRTNRRTKTTPRGGRKPGGLKGQDGRSLADAGTMSRVSSTETPLRHGKLADLGSVSRSESPL